MKIFNDVFSKVSEASTKMGETTKTKIQENRLNKEYSNLESEMNEKLRLLGAEVYDLLEKGKELGDFKEIRSEIKSIYNQQIKVLSDIQKISKSSVKCKNCSNLYDSSYDYCPVCGEKRS